MKIEIERKFIHEKVNVWYPTSLLIFSQFGPFAPLWKTGAGVGNTYWTIYARPDQDDAEDGRWQIAEIRDNIARWLTRTDYDILSLLYFDEANDYL